MANFQVKDSTGTSVYFKSTGTGTNGDPFIPSHTFTGTTAGDVANDAADSGNPIKIGGLARTTNINAVQTGDRVNAVFDSQGRQTVTFAIPGTTISGVSAAITGTADTQVIAAAGSGVRNYITHFVVFNSHATVATQVNIKDGATTLYSVYVTAAGGQIAVTLPVPIRTSANTALNAACVTTGSNVIVSASGYTGA